MSESMIERVLAEFWGKTPRCDLMRVSKSTSGCSAYDEPETMCICRRHMLGIVRAAVAAMREPTEAMVSAGEKPFDEPFTGGRLTPAFSVWGAMIDAALEPPPE